MKTILKPNYQTYRATGETKLWHYGTLWVIADKGEVNLDNPGDGTPAMVYKVDRHGCIEYSATFWCALGESDLDGYSLTDSQWEWLSKIQKAMEKFLYGTNKK